ncbi:phytanoyl-CoA dioxygenase family protein [Nonomuraea sp. NPDC050227]|uniref:phytanoyl-CoA dioxygenase family protein n=1 Tax=Nonomuraea sp. NPDC050227 TaxID=3364360 RepID=UPI0037960EBD
MEEEIDAFARDGFTLLRRVFSSAQLSRMRKAFIRIEDSVRVAPDRYATRYTARDGGADTWGVNHVFAPDLYEPELASVFDDARVMGFVHAVLGQPVRFWGGHALWGPRRVAYQLNWHRDFGEHEAFDPSGRSTHVQFNACLLADECFRVIPGSHRRPLTVEEAEQQRTKGIAPLPGEVSVQCAPGDVLMMNAHALHRGSCDVGVARQTLHVSLQPYAEPTGGHASWRFMRTPGYLDGLPAPLRELMHNAVTWDDEHRLSLAEMRRRLRISRDIKKQLADGGPANMGS